MRESKGGVTLDMILRMEWGDLVAWWAQAREMIEATRGHTHK
jgi:hypothetical protein